MLYQIVKESHVTIAVIGNLILFTNIFLKELIEKYISLPSKMILTYYVYIFYNIYLLLSCIGISSYKYKKSV